MKFADKHAKQNGAPVMPAVLQKQAHAHGAARKVPVPPLAE